METSKNKKAPLMELEDLNLPGNNTKETPRSGVIPDSILDQSPTAEVKHVREDGKVKKRPIELQGLSSKILPPLMKKRVAVYESISKGEVDPLTNEPITPSPVVIPGTFVVFDPYHDNPMDRHRMLRNVTRQEIVVENNRQIQKDYVEDIIMDNGGMIVSCDRDYLLYVLMELHPLNASNKFRDTSISPAFRRVDVVKRSWGESLVNLDLAFEAEKSVVDLRKPDDIITLATAAGIPTAGRVLEGESSVKYDLRVFARKNPRDFFKLNKTADMSVKISVLDAINLGLIEYSPDKRAWLFTTEFEQKITHLPGEDPTEALIKLLQKPQYQEHYMVLQDQLNYWD